MYKWFKCCFISASNQKNPAMQALKAQYGIKWLKLYNWVKLSDRLSMRTLAAEQRLSASPHWTPKKKPLLWAVFTSQILKLMETRHHMSFCISSSEQHWWQWLLIHFGLNWLKWGLSSPRETTQNRSPCCWVHVKAGLWEAHTDWCSLPFLHALSNTKDFNAIGTTQPHLPPITNKEQWGLVWAPLFFEGLLQGWNYKQKCISTPVWGNLLI